MDGNKSRYRNRNHGITVASTPGDTGDVQRVESSLNFFTLASTIDQAAD